MTESSWPVVTRRLGQSSLQPSVQENVLRNIAISVQIAK